MSTRNEQLLIILPNCDVLRRWARGYKCEGILSQCIRFGMSWECLSSAIMALGSPCLGAELSRHHGTVQLSIDHSPLIPAVCSVNRMYVHHQSFARLTYFLSLGYTIPVGRTTARVIAPRKQAKLPVFCLRRTIMSDMDVANPLICRFDAAPAA